MPIPTSPVLARDIAAALDWWREAGVDATFGDTPRKWLGEPKGASPPVEPSQTAAAAPLPTPPPAPAIGGDRARWPGDLESFRNWWLEEPSLDEGGLAPRIAPRGDAGAELMVLVAMPEEHDRETILTGREGQLLSGFLAAAGLPDERLYLASVLPRHTPMADWRQITADGMGAVLAHHVMLARPKRLLVLGQSILPLCGHDPAQGSPNLQSFNHEGGRVPALHEAGLDRLLAKPALRARLWQRWLDWTDGQTWDEPHG